MIEEKGSSQEFSDAIVKAFKKNPKNSSNGNLGLLWKARKSGICIMKTEN